MLTNCVFNNIILKILIVSRFLSIFFFRRSLIAISNDFIFSIDHIRFAKIIIFTTLNSLRIAVYETRRYLNVNENCKDQRFTYNITLHTMLRFVSFCSIEDISKITI